MGRVERERELARMRHRKMKLKKLRNRYEAANSSDTKQQILAKARKLSPFVDFETQEANT